MISCHYCRKCIGNSTENMQSDVRVLWVKMVFGELISGRLGVITEGVKQLIMVI